MPPRKRHVIQARGLIVVVALIALSGSLGVEFLGARLEDAHEAEEGLLQTTALVNRRSALEWQAVAAGEVETSLWDAIEANRVALLAASSGLLEHGIGDPEVADMVVLVRRYGAAVDSMVGYVRQGDLARAEVEDEEVVDPLFEAIHAAADGMLVAYSGRAELVSTVSRVGTVGLLAAAAILVAFLSRGATRREAEGRLGARFRSLVQNSSDLVTILRQDGTIAYEGPSIERLLGHSSDEAVGAAYASLVHPDDVARLDRLVDAARERRGGLGATEIVRMAHADGTWRQFETVARNLEHDPDIAGVVLTARDSTERERLADRVRYQAAHDELTGLANRKTFLDRVEASLAQPGSVAVLFIDLDDFKGLNDNLGHGVGDRVLAVVADRVRETIRPHDLAARLGGDEFGVLLTEINPDTGPQLVADRLIRAVCAPIEVSGTSFRPSASVGIAVGRSGHRSADLLSEADLAMYSAKRAGKGGFAVFEPSLQAASRDRLELHHELMGAIDRDELVVHYQPIVSLPGGMIEGVEALVRWVHPIRGLIPPMAFIPLAEETGLIGPIGEWVLREAARDVASWRRTRAGRALGVSVNVSVWQLADGAFADRVAAIVAEARIPAKCLTLEITESVFADPSPALTANLDQLRARGVQIAIDDFGTGYSSLGYLPRLPIDVLKIDRIFVSPADGSAVDPALPRAIIQMADALGLRTVAEGVESLEQLDRLGELGCQMAQGFVLSRPVPAEAVSALLEGGLLAPPVKRVGEFAVAVGLAS